MTAVPIADFAASALAFLSRVEAGESFEIVRDGRPVGRLGPAPDTPAEVVTGDSHPRDMLLGIVAPTRPLDLLSPSVPVTPERRRPDINLAWFPPHDDE